MLDTITLDRFRAGFRRTARGSLHQLFAGLSITVFPQNGGYRWCLANADGPDFSLDTFADERDAIEDIFTLIQNAEEQ